MGGVKREKGMSELEYWNISRLHESLGAARGGESNVVKTREAKAAGPRSSRLLLVAAFGAVYLIWGSTYLGIKYAIETIPPFLMAGSRFLIAGALLCAWSVLRRGASKERLAGRASWPHWRTALVVGGSLFLLGNGGVTWAEHRLASSLAALLVATEPLWIVLLSWSRPNGERPGPKTLLGLLVGFAGVWLLISPAANGASRVDVVGAVAVLLAAFSWAAGSIYSLRAPVPRSPLMASGMQMLAGGVLLVLASGLTGEWSRFTVADVSWRSLMAFGYLVFFGSVIAFTAYSWLLHAVAPARAATYAYVNPAVAVALGWAFGGEVMTQRTVLGAAVIVASVGLITTYKRRENAKPRASADKATDKAATARISGVACAAQRSS
jgi:drug/metabolite transporter (DMT)-like permease